jgi:dTDP-4-dehydrorhamnose reductase
VAVACQRFDTTLMHLSTNYVFGGVEPPENGYREFDAPTPINTYGLSKQWAEDFVRSLLNKYFIVRTAGLFGAGRHCFAEEIIEACLKGHPVQAANWTGSYTHTVDLAEAMARLAESNLYGIYHLVNAGAGSRAEFIRQVSSYLAPSGGFKIVEVGEKGLKRPAQRPGQSTLDTLHWRLSGFEPLRPWKEAVGDFVKKMKNTRISP